MASPHPPVPKPRAKPRPSPQVKSRSPDPTPEVGSSSFQPPQRPPPPVIRKFPVPEAVKEEDSGEGAPSIMSTPSQHPDNPISPVSSYEAPMSIKDQMSCLPPLAKPHPNVGGGGAEDDDIDPAYADIDAASKRQSDYVNSDLIGLSDEELEDDADGGSVHSIRGGQSKYAPSIKLHSHPLLQKSQSSDVTGAPANKKPKNRAPPPPPETGKVSKISGAGGAGGNATKHKRSQSDFKVGPSEGQVASSAAADNTPSTHHLQTPSGQTAKSGAEGRRSSTPNQSSSSAVSGVLRKTPMRPHPSYPPPLPPGAKARANQTAEPASRPGNAKEDGSHLGPPPPRPSATPTDNDQSPSSSSNTTPTFKPKRHAPPPPAGGASARKTPTSSPEVGRRRETPPPPSYAAVMKVKKTQLSTGSDGGGGGGGGDGAPPKPSRRSRSLEGLCDMVETPSPSQESAAESQVREIRSPSYDAFEEVLTVMDLLTIELRKDGGQSTGLVIVQGKIRSGSGVMADGVFIKDVIPDSPAGQDGRIIPGDMLIEVYGIAIKDGCYEDAYGLLEQPTSSVRIKVGRPDITSSVFTISGNKEEPIYGNSPAQQELLEKLEKARLCAAEFEKDKELAIKALEDYKKKDNLEREDLRKDIEDISEAFDQYKRDSEEKASDLSLTLAAVTVGRTKAESEANVHREALEDLKQQLEEEKSKAEKDLEIVKKNLMETEEKLKSQGLVKSEANQITELKQELAKSKSESSKAWAELTEEKKKVAELEKRLKTAEDDARIEKALNDRLQKSINDQALEISRMTLEVEQLRKDLAEANSRTISETTEKETNQAKLPPIHNEKQDPPSNNVNARPESPLSEEDIVIQKNVALLSGSESDKEDDPFSSNTPPNAVSGPCPYIEFVPLSMDVKTSFSDDNPEPKKSEKKKKEPKGKGEEPKDKEEEPKDKEEQPKKEEPKEKREEPKEKEEEPKEKEEEPKEEEEEPEENGKTGISAEDSGYGVGEEFLPGDTSEARAEGVNTKSTEVAADVSTSESATPGDDEKLDSKSDAETASVDASTDSQDPIAEFDEIKPLQKLDTSLAQYKTQVRGAFKRKLPSKGHLKDMASNSGDILYNVPDDLLSKLDKPLEEPVPEPSEAVPSHDVSHDVPDETKETGGGGGPVPQPKPRPKARKRPQPAPPSSTEEGDKMGDKKPTPAPQAAPRSRQSAEEGKETAGQEGSGKSFDGGNGGGEGEEDGKPAEGGAPENTEVRDSDAIEKSPSLVVKSPHIGPKPSPKGGKPPAKDPPSATPRRSSTSSDGVTSPSSDKEDQAQSLSKKDPSQLTVKEKAMLAQKVFLGTPDKHKPGPPTPRKPKPTPGGSGGGVTSPELQETHATPTSMREKLQKSQSVDEENIGNRKGSDSSNSPQHKKKLPPGAFNMMMMGGLGGGGGGGDRSRSSTVSSHMEPVPRKRNNSDHQRSRGSSDSHDDSAVTKDEEDEVTDGPPIANPSPPVKSPRHMTPVKKPSLDETPPEVESDTGSTSSPQVPSKMAHKDSNDEDSGDDNGEDGTTGGGGGNADLDYDLAWTWIPDDVAIWLGKVGLGAYKQVFVDKQVHGHMLLDMDGHRLKGMGMNSHDDRALFKKEIKILKPFAEKQKKIIEKQRKEEKKNAKKKKK